MAARLLAVGDGAPLLAPDLGACAEGPGPHRNPGTTPACLFIQPTWHLPLGQAWVGGLLPPLGSESPAWKRGASKPGRGKAGCRPGSQAHAALVAGQLCGG